MLIKKNLSFTRIININNVRSRFTICYYNIKIFLQKIEYSNYIVYDLFILKQINKSNEAIKIWNVICKFIAIIYKIIKSNNCLLLNLQTIITF